MKGISRRWESIVRALVELVYRERLQIDGDHLVPETLVSGCCY